MRLSIRNTGWLLLFVLLHSCSKKSADAPPDTPPANFNIAAWLVDGVPSQTSSRNISTSPVVKLRLPTVVDRSSVAAAVSWKEASGASVDYTVSYELADSVVVLQPAQPLKHLTAYVVTVSNQLKATNGGRLRSPLSISLITAIDSTDKFPRIPTDSLLTLVQQQTFKYFWEFAHPVSGLARERNTSGDVVTTGGSGFGIMAIITAIHRQFITRAEGLARLQKMVAFLETADRFHGAFPHWLNGATGKVVPFSAKDNGADLVETSFLMQGLLAARQYFNGSDAAETALRNDINELWQAVEWDWFRRGSENVLYWHWSPNYGWEMNHRIQGWNEALITYVLAAASPSHSIPKEVYDEGWARNGAIRNGNTYYGFRLPLGSPLGGPLFFAHYSFLGINPNNLKDQYADYGEQNCNHTRINHAYCKDNPKGFYGYSEQCWGLTASDDNKVGYLAHEPANDNGVIAPTAALSSFPYTPEESLKALEFFYYKLGDKLWKEYGFVDAFNLADLWFADSFLAIDQGPIIVMIENYRSSLLWELFTSCPEVKSGLKKLGFTAPYL